MKRKLLFIVPIILIIIALISIFAIYPKVVYKKDIGILQKKIFLVNDYMINDKSDIKAIKEELQKELVSNKRKDIEKETNKYLSSIIDNLEKWKNIDSDNKILNMHLNDKFKENLDDNIKYLDDINIKLQAIKQALNELKDIEVINIQDEDNKKILIDLFHNDFKMQNYNDEIANYEKNIIDYINKYEYLKKNKNTWNYENHKIVFNKRSNFNDYKKISSDDNYELIKDTKGPVITANNITIIKGNKVNIKDKVHCEDLVDGKTECKIDGKYDINKVGNYNIKITSTDQSKNASYKTIKLIIKEKVVNKKPYYIEVIRNQNVVIVYGLDSNKEYTKIVKVFICSVGKSNSKTPLGTFKTQDKASWGWLVGNLYGQYYTRITGSILFHSVPYTKKAKNTLEWDEYNKLGSPASKGCVRMTVKDVKWIYDNCPRGTTVKIYDGNLPKGVSKPSVNKINGDSPNKGWDPTDPDKNNPWKK